MTDELQKIFEYLKEENFAERQWRATRRAQEGAQQDEWSNINTPSELYWICVKKNSLQIARQDLKW